MIQEDFDAPRSSVVDVGILLANKRLGIQPFGCVNGTQQVFIQEAAGSALALDQPLVILTNDLKQRLMIAIFRTWE
jgi:hypothetical protein